MDFATLREANLARQIEWVGDKGQSRGVRFACIELAGEVGELCNAMKKHIRHEDGLPGGVAGVQPLIDELADVVICADLMGIALGVDLSAAVARKFNATSAKHGFQTKLPE